MCRRGDGELYDGKMGVVSTALDCEWWQSRSLEGEERDASRQRGGQCSSTRDGARTTFSADRRECTGCLQG